MGDYLIEFSCHERFKTYIKEDIFILIVFVCGCQQINYEIMTTVMMKSVLLHLGYIFERNISYTTLTGEPNPEQSHNLSHHIVK